MRAFLSKFLLSIFIAVFVLPASLFAQTDWVPPTGGPTTPGTNTPAPVNVGSQNQTKTGGLSLLNGLSVKGPGIFDSSSLPSNNFFLSFNPAWFTNSVNIGVPFFSASDIGAELNVFGKIRYVPASVGGGESGPQPAVNSVLKSADADGNLVWGAPMPDGTTNGDTLIWNSTCNCWETGPGGGGGGGNLPGGTAGQTMWYNGATNQWEATNQIKHDTYVDPDGVTMTRTALNNYNTRLDSPLVSVGIPLPDSSTIIQTELTTIPGKQIIIGRGTTNDSANLFLRSDNVTFVRQSTFNGPQTVPQKVIFNSDSVKFKGPVSTPDLFDAGTGRIPLSADNDGTFKWNRYLTYTQTEPTPGVALGQLTLSNPLNGIAAFSNQGLTWLKDDTVISPDGDLYLEGLDGGSYTQWAAGQIKHLCYLEGSFKVVFCPPTAFPGDAPTTGTVTPIGSQGEGTALFTTVHNGSQFTFNFTGTVDVKYCGGGGGGGGGGIGSPANSESATSPGTGGSGGGGGAAGDCITESLDVVNGDTITWDIGYGGDKGYRAYLEYMTANPNGQLISYVREASTNGGQGEPTSVTFDPLSGASYQIGELAEGGMGGSGGQSVFQMTVSGQTQPFPGTSGNGSLWTQQGWNGQPGATTNSSANCNSCGGQGGWGEAYDSNGNILTYISGTTPSAGGGGGIGASTSSEVFYGKNGRCGAHGHGGGGGGGSFGLFTTNYNILSGNILSGQGTSTLRQSKGGDGGCGGGGYVLISGLPEDITSGPGINEIIFDTPGNNTLSPAQINAINEVVANNVDNDPLNFTVEVWGAGGGAGGVMLGSNQRSGGGGSGEYQKSTMNSQTLLNSLFVVGGRGANGVSNSNINSVTSGARGGQTRAGNVQAEGGWGGYGGNIFNTTIPPRFGKGGGWNDDLNDGFTSPSEGYGFPPNSSTYNRGSEGAAPVSGSSMGPCNLAGESTTSTLGFGGGAPRSCTDPTLNIYQGQAQNGRIRISW
jgi:hypothetical protein